MTKEKFEKLQKYIMALRQFDSRENIQENWLTLFDSVLEKVTQYCLGEVTYCFHKVENGTISFVHGGPPTYIVHRENTENSSVDNGLIGETIRKGKTFAIYPNVNEYSDLYIEGNKRTKSELVIVMPSPSSDDSIGVINIESNQIDAFDEIDGIGLSFIGTWASLLQNHAEQKDKVSNALESISSDFKKIQSLSNKDDKKKVVFESLFDFIDSMIQPDALAIVSLSPGNRQSASSKSSYRYEHSRGYRVNIEDEDAWNEEYSFPSHVIRNHMNIASGQETTLVEVDTDLTFDQFRLKESRPTTSFAIGIGFSYRSTQAVKFGALILEFDKAPKRDKFLLRNLRSLTHAQISLAQQIDLINERENLRKAIQGLSSIYNIAPSSRGFKEFLNKAPRKIVEDTHASGCAFYEIDPSHNVDHYNEDNEERGFLKELGYFGNNKRSNVFWRNRFNNEWISHLRGASLERQSKEFLIDISSSEKGKFSTYSVFAKSITILDKKVLFVSFKKVISPYNESKVSETSRDILNAYISAVERIVEEKLREVTNEFQQQGLTQVVRMWLAHVAKTAKGDKAEIRNQLFIAVHEFLLSWGPTQTPLSAIYLIEDADGDLVMAKSTLDHLREHLRKQSRDKVESLPTIAPLKFDISSSHIEAKGLTQKVLKNYEPLLSFNVTTEGNPHCREFWDAISETPAEQRWFAGAPICHSSDDSPTHEYGVLTINGIKPLTLFQQLQTGPSILPVIRIVAEELGAQLHKLEQ